MPYGEYDPQVLRELQRISTLILAEMDRVCVELGIPYFIYAGTAIGAVRHGGFIPWDDDIDIGMFRDDYELFLEKAPLVLGPDFSITNGMTDEHFPACNSNLSLIGTYCVPSEFDKCEFQYPIGIGIFAFDRVSADAAVRRKQLRKTWLWGRMAFLRETGSPNLFIKGWKRRAVALACQAIHCFLANFHVSQRWIHEKWQEAARLAEDESGDLFADFTDGDPLRWSVEKGEVFPLRRIPFETIEVFIAKDADAILSRGYGDYMELPPEEDRKNHHPSRLDFGKFA